MEIWHYALIIIFLQILSAFFSGTETAITTASRARLHQLGQEGNHRAKLAYSLREQKEKLLSTLLVGNNMVNTAAAATATAMLTQVFEGDSGAGAVFATLLITVTLLIFSEVLPKTFAIHHSLAATLAVAPIMRFLMWILTPLTWGIISLVRGILILCRANPNEIAVSSNADELKGAIDLHRGPDEDVAQERAMLRSILDLSNVEVKNIMTHRRNLDTVDASLPATQIVEQALETGFTRIPLWKSAPENIIGVLHAKALLKEIQRVGGDLEQIDMAKVATKPWFIPESTNLLEQLQAFRARREHFALVVDEYGGLQGIVTLEDILEEIVGDIGDETDSDLPGVIRQPNGSFLIDGGVTLRELNRQFEWSLPESDAATIAGLVLHEARRVPEIGQTFEFHGFRFEIIRRLRNQVTQLRVWPLGRNERHGSDTGT